MPICGITPRRERRVRASAAADFPGLPMAASAADAIERLDVDALRRTLAEPELPSFAEALAVQRGVEAILTLRGRDE